MKADALRNLYESARHYCRTNRKKVGKAFVIAIILIAAVMFRVTQSARQETIAKSQTQTETASGEETTEICVDISGEVNNPGVYMLDDGTRLYELITEAGGTTEDADLDSINQAETVTDGQKIIIPAKGGDDGSESANGQSSSSDESSSGLININTASAEELKNLPGVVDAIAQRIIDYRTETRFKSIEDITNVSGIGDKTFEKMKALITI